MRAPRDHRLFVGDGDVSGGVLDAQLLDDRGEEVRGNIERLEADRETGRVERGVLEDGRKRVGNGMPKNDQSRRRARVHRGLSVLDVRTPTSG